MNDNEAAQVWAETKDKKCQSCGSKDIDLTIRTEKMYTSNGYHRYGGSPLYSYYCNKCRHECVGFTYLRDLINFVRR